MTRNNVRKKAHKDAYPDPTFGKESWELYCTTIQCDTPCLLENHNPLYTQYRFDLEITKTWVQSSPTSASSDQCSKDFDCTVCVLTSIQRQANNCA
jgi:hypothetical protein